MIFLWRLECYILGVDILLGIGFGGGGVDLIGTWNFLMRRSLNLMQDALSYKEETFGGPTFHPQAQQLAPNAKTFP
jgi:hypothetical protein